MDKVRIGELSLSITRVSRYWLFIDQHGVRLLETMQQTMLSICRRQSTVKEMRMTSTVFITGATSGFGEATARRFAEAGWKLVLTGRRKERLDALCAELSAKTLVHGLAVDVRDRQAMEQAIASLPPTFDKLQGLVNNAGLALGASPARTATWTTGKPWSTPTSRA